MTILARFCQNVSYANYLNTEVTHVDLANLAILFILAMSYCMFYLTVPEFIIFLFSWHIAKFYIDDQKKLSWLGFSLLWHCTNVYICQKL